jgi:heme exporter protein C
VQTSRSHLSVRLRLCTLASLGAAMLMALFHAPVDPLMGPIQKLIYIHLPAAVASLVAAFVVFVASLAFLWTRRRLWSRLANAAAGATVACSLMVLGTGMLWAKVYWGSWWTWSPRLTFTLGMSVLYIGYLLIDRLIVPATRRWTACAVYGSIAYLEVPLVYLSMRLLADVHPDSIPLSSEMKVTLVPWFLFFLCACAELIASPFLRTGRPASRRPASLDLPVSGVH